MIWKVNLTDCWQRNFTYPGVSLTNKQINFAQVLFSKQNPKISEFFALYSSYCLQSGLNIIQCHAYHWVTAFNRNPCCGLQFIVQLCRWHCQNHGYKHISNSQDKNSFYAKQSASCNNCGLFMISRSIPLLLEQNPGEIMFDKEKMRDHVIDCFERKNMTSFPVQQY